LIDYLALSGVGKVPPGLASEPAAPAPAPSLVAVKSGGPGKR
jgi:hypothetical protein